MLGFTYKSNLKRYVEQLKSDPRAKSRMERSLRLTRRHLREKLKVVQRNSKLITKFLTERWLKSPPKTVLKSPPRMTPDLPELEEESLFEVHYTVSLHEARANIIRAAQMHVFHKEIARLQAGQLVPRASILYKQRPSLNDEQFLVVRGRFPDVEKHNHLIVLPRGHFVTRLIVTDIHINKMRHVGGTQWTLSEIKKEYWSPNLRNLIVSVLKACYLCGVRAPAPFKTPMSPLHPAKMPGAFGESVKPFSFGGAVNVDYAGPFVVSMGPRRKTEKRWVCVFACQSTRAVSLVKIRSLLTSDALVSFITFMLRRGVPEAFVSDNASNLVKTDKEILKIHENVERIKDKLDNEFGHFPKIQWLYTAAESPHQNAAVERLIGIMKRSLEKMARVSPKKGQLRDEELELLLARVESVMNSRPLTPTQTVLGTEEVLTPNHFAVGNVSPMRLWVPESIRSKVRNDFNWKWMAVEDQIERYWKQMQTEYREELRKCPKWNTGSGINLQAGDVVLVLDKMTEDRLSWPKAVVLGTEKDANGVTQTVRIRFKNRETRRSIHKLAPCPGFF